jgi:hypothetical protein
MEHKQLRDETKIVKWDVNLNELGMFDPLFEGQIEDEHLNEIHKLKLKSSGQPTILSEHKNSREL